MLTIISGVTSVGKSIILEALREGGVKIINDYISNIDKGVTQDILEYEKIEQITDQTLWFEEGEEWAVSLVSVLLKKLPLTNNYNVIFVERDINDIISSNENIFANIITSKENIIQDNLKKAFIEAHSNRIKKWLYQNPNFNTVLVDYDSLIKKPNETINEINKKLRLIFNIEESHAVVENNKF